MKNNKKNLILYLVLFIVFIVIIKYLLVMYEKIDYHDFEKVELVSGVSDFTRDENNKVDKYNSYKIESKDFNDAMFYKEISVEKDTPYKITCMVKTNNVETQDIVSDAGAQISIADSVEKSKSITGTNNWQLMINSKNRDKIKVGFRLGGNDGNCKGEAWFSNFTISKGTLTSDNNWNFACFILNNTDIDLKVKNMDYNLKATMSNYDKNDIKNNMQRFKNSCEQLSKNQMKVSYDIIEIEAPLTSLSYDENSKYYVAPKDIKEKIDPYLQEEIYDHIFVFFRTGTVNNPTPVSLNDWLGLGGMDYNGIGFSEVQLVEDNNNYIFRYNPMANTFPEEVLVHEFLHTLERNLNDYDYNFPALHDNEKYGYVDQKLLGLKQWYKDYMIDNINGKDGNKTGLDVKVYEMQPINSENFENSVDLTDENFKESKGTFAELKNMFKAIKNKLKTKEALIKTNIFSTD